MLRVHFTGRMTGLPDGSHDIAGTWPVPIT